ncbi:hypothetical protein [Methanococcus maripaludis]|uniref:NADH:ubiquinone oxidoreductase subunit 6 (Subunit J) n=1 Tax=Methanococcus maripaludis TaxID=39152 RepID=A0A7J9SF57_METMI|nr:hypothetical protein [Methanococcus maripaludis]MBB6497780.1 NADH:ubiquinone oxidoreductase subunit 6 (subunit J) [Methanococcus maripaludis]
MHILVKIFILLAFVTILMSLMVVTKSKNNTENVWALLDKNASEDI